MCGLELERDVGLVVVWVATLDESSEREVSGSLSL